MRRMLENQVPFPADAESDSFTGALASALVIAKGYTGETPYWCTRNRRYCVHCGPCGDDLLERHQTSIYHCLLTASTLAFGFDYPWDDTVEPHTLPGFHRGWRWDGGFVDGLARFAGFAYSRFDGTAPGEALSCIKSSIDAGLPSLLRLGEGPEWLMAAGYDGDTIYALGSRLGPLPDGWQSGLSDAVVITGVREPEMSYRELLERIAAALSYSEHEALEGVIMDALSSVTEENAMDTAGMLCGIDGVLVEARWHAGEAFAGEGNLLWGICPDIETHRRLGEVFFDRYIKEGNDETHGIGWRIWEALGVGPETGYGITPKSAELVLREGTREALRRLFARVFENDRAVCAEVRACLEKM